MIQNQNFNGLESNVENSSFSVFVRDSGAVMDTGSYLRSPDVIHVPLRLIDVDATLKEDNDGHIFFCQATDWSDFDIISHSWSQHIRKLSKAVADEIKECNTSTHEPLSIAVKSYNHAFQARKWINSDDTRDAYVAIKEFLQILQREGVKKVWFDAICINQRSDAEKEREIPRMSDFYKYSRACYVPINGFGEQNAGKLRSCKGSCGLNDLGNSETRTITIKSANGSRWDVPVPIKHSVESASLSEGAPCSQGCGGINDYALPKGEDLVNLRWVNRVWTLQELLLPQNMYFIVQLDTWVEEIIAALLAASGRTHICKCVLDCMLDIFKMMCHTCEVFSLEGVLDETFNKLKNLASHSEQISVSELSITDASNGDLDISKSSRKQQTDQYCPKCSLGETVMRRLDHQHQQPRLYLVDRSVLFIVLGCLSHAYLHEGKDPNSDSGLICTRYDGLLRLISNRCAITPAQLQLDVVSEIRYRHCDEVKHPQDRVLGILGLLDRKVRKAKAKFVTESFFRIIGELDMENFKITAKKKSPEKQFVELACQNIFSDSLLLSVCFMDPDGGRDLKGMSWIPDLTRTALYKHTSKGVSCIGSFGISELTAKVIGISYKGPITLAVPVLKGHAHCNSESIIWVSDSDCTEQKKLSIKFWRNKPSPFYIVYPLTHYPPLNGLFGHIRLPLQDVLDNHNCTFQFEVWMLPIFFITNIQEECAVLVCLRYAGLPPESPLHKIGTLTTSETDFDTIWTSLPKEQVTVGGFRDLDWRNIFKEQAKNGGA